MAELDADLTLARGHFAARFACALGAGLHVLAGPSGSGKSTVLEALAGVLTPSGGHIRFGGEVWFDGRARLPPERRGVGWVPQSAALFPHLDVRANVTFALRGAVDAAALAALGERLAMTHLWTRRAHTLSGGEAQRVALARALLRRPRLLLLDEPFAALDRALRDRVAGELRRWVAEAAVPAILVTHDDDDAALAVSEGGQRLALPEPAPHAR